MGVMTDTLTSTWEWMGPEGKIRRIVRVGNRTLSRVIHRPVDPLPAVRVGTKILICRKRFWNAVGWEAHQVKRLDVDIGLWTSLVAGLEVKD